MTEPRTRRQQRLVLGVAIAYALIAGAFLIAAVVVVWATPFGSRP